MTTTTQAAASGTFDIGGDLRVARLGYGAMRLTGKGIWGDVSDRDAAAAVLRRALELGITLIDTADAYGPETNELLIAEVLHPYPSDLVIATKAGLTRTGPDEWHPVGRPEYLRQCLELSLRRLRVDTIDLYQLHRIDPKIPAAEQLGVLAEAQQAGKIRHIGLSEVDVDALDDARTHVEVATVQNRYNVVDREHDAVLARCVELGIGFIPWFPVAVGKLAASGGPLDELSSRVGATPNQLALAWLLARSEVILPIPGTSSVEHLEENTAAAEVTLDGDVIAELDALAAQAG